MNLNLRHHKAIRSVKSPFAYLMIECLVYIGVVFALLGAGYAAMYRCIDNSVALRRSADDITRSLRAGERWRADVRSANAAIRLDKSGAEQVLQIPTEHGDIAYWFLTNAVFRHSANHPWSQILSDVKSASVESETRQDLTVWRWELELESRAKAGRVKPLFTFIGVQGGKVIK